MSSAVATVLSLLLATVFGWRLAPRLAEPGSNGPPLPERLFVALAWAYLLLAWLGIVLAEAGLLGGAALALGCTVALVVSWCAGGWYALEARARDPVWIAWVLATGLTLGLATPVVEARYEASDAGVYRLTAARLQQGGSWAYHDEFVASLPDDLRARAFPAPDGRTASRGMGFYLEEPATGRVVPQFQPLAAVIMAIGRLVAGPRGAEAAILAVAVLGLVAVFVLARDLGGLMAGVLAAVWTGANIVIWWFVRYGTAEAFAMLLVGTAMYALLRERRDDSVPAGAMAGWALGLLWLCKLEMLLLGLPLGVLFLYDVGTARIRQRSTQVLWGTLFLATAHFFVHAWGWSFPYVHDVLLIPQVTLRTVTTMAVVLVGLAMALWGWRVARDGPTPGVLERYDAGRGSAPVWVNGIDPRGVAGSPPGLRVRLSSPRVGPVQPS